MNESNPVQPRVTFNAYFQETYVLWSGEWQYSSYKYVWSSMKEIRSAVDAKKTYHYGSDRSKCFSEFRRRRFLACKDADEERDPCCRKRNDESCEILVSLGMRLKSAVLVF